MARTFDFLGAYKGYFTKASLDVYFMQSGGSSMQYVGKTQNEKTLTPGVENVEWYDNTGGTQILYAMDIDKIAPAIKFSFMQVADPNVLAMALNADMDDSDPAIFRGFVGSEPEAYTEGEWRFACQSTGGLLMTLVFRRGLAFSSGDIAMGAPGAYAEVPITVRALQDTTITDKKRDLFYWELEQRAFS
jgi:hypothetical protein